MPILKNVDQQENYTQIPNKLLQDKDLRYEDKGLLVELLSRPPDWTVHKEQLIKDHTGKDKVNSIFGRLQEKGYLALCTSRCDNGQIKDRFWLVGHKPRTAEQWITACKSTFDMEVCAEKPNNGKAYVRLTAIKVNPHLQIKKEEYKEKEGTKEREERNCVPKNFKIFYQEYPRKQAKAVALRSWQKLMPDDGLFEAIMSALRYQKGSRQWQEDNGRFIPMPATWLNQRRWEDKVPTVDKLETEALNDYSRIVGE